MKIFISLVVLFILLSFTDLYLTYKLVGNNHLHEVNPVAAQVIKHCGFNGLIWFKVTVIIVTTSIFGAIHKINERAATKMVLFACCLLGGVIAYSLTAFI